MPSWLFDRGHRLAGHPGEGGDLLFCKKFFFFFFFFFFFLKKKKKKKKKNLLQPRREFQPRLCNKRGQGPHPHFVGHLFLHRPPIGPSVWVRSPLSTKAAHGNMARQPSRRRGAHCLPDFLVTHHEKHVVQRHHTARQCPFSRLRVNSETLPGLRPAPSRLPPLMFAPF